MLMRRARAQLLVVDLQERLLPAIPRGEAVLARARILVRAATRLDVPIVVTEHCPDKIGGTAAGLRAVLPGMAQILPKTTFSAADDPVVLDALDAARTSGRDQIVVCGTEAHVCVLQTALGLRSRGLEVCVVADAVASRSDDDMHAAGARLLHAGVHRVTSEMVVFEWAERADDPAFKDLLGLIK